MVIGKINQIFPEYKIRFSTMKKRFDKAFDDIFILSDESCAITSNALDQVTQYVPTPAAYVASARRGAGQYTWPEYSSKKQFGEFDPEAYYKANKRQTFSAGKVKESRPYDVDAWRTGIATRLKEEEELSPYDLIKQSAAANRESYAGELMGNW